MILEQIFTKGTQHPTPHFQEAKSFLSGSQVEELQVCSLLF